MKYYALVQYVSAHIQIFRSPFIVATYTNQSSEQDTSSDIIAGCCERTSFSFRLAAQGRNVHGWGGVAAPSPSIIIVCKTH